MLQVTRELFLSQSSPYLVLSYDKRRFVTCSNVDRKEGYVHRTQPAAKSTGESSCNYGPNELSWLLGQAFPEPHRIDPTPSILWLSIILYTPFVPRM